MKVVGTAAQKFRGGDFKEKKVWADAGMSQSWRHVEDRRPLMSDFTASPKSLNDPPPAMSSTWTTPWHIPNIICN
jgi:hypothetical protein